MSKANISHDPTQNKNSEHQAEPWAKLPNSWLDLPVSNNAKVLLWLLDQMQGDNKPQIQVGQEYLSQRLKVSRHTITRAANELIALGVIARRGTWGKSVYQVFNPARRSFGSNMNHEGSNPAPLEGSKVAPLIIKEHLIKENKQTNETEQATLEVAASVIAVGSAPTSYKDCNDQERSYVKAFAVSLENQIGGSVYPGSFKAETLAAVLLASNQGYTAQEAASMCSQYYQQEQQRKASQGLEPIRSATRWLIAILPSVLAGAEAEELNSEIPDYLPAQLEYWAFDSRKFATAEERDEYEVARRQLIRERGEMAEVVIYAELPKPEPKIELSPAELKAQKIAKFKQRHPNRTNRELKAYWYNQQGSVITDEELDL